MCSQELTTVMQARGSRSVKHLRPQNTCVVFRGRKCKRMHVQPCCTCAVCARTHVCTFFCTFARSLARSLLARLLACMHVLSQMLS